MAELMVTDSDLTSVADAIRTKGNISGSLVFPGGFVSAIEALEALYPDGDDIAYGTASGGN